METFIVTSAKTMLSGNMNKSGAQRSIVQEFFVNFLDFKSGGRESHKRRGIRPWLFFERFQVHPSRSSLVVIKEQKDAVIGVLVGVTAIAALPAMRSASSFPITPL